MPLSETYRCARAIEAVENYAKANDPFRHRLTEIDVQDIHNRDNDFYYSPDGLVFGGPYPDREFWTSIIENPDKYWGMKFLLERFVISEWIARVPGLYWSEGSARMRELAQSAVEHQSREWTTFTPSGKTAIVLGGVGTLKFPPNEAGIRLVTLSAGHNASSGIPALVFPEVWEYHHLKEGDVLRLSAHWQKMALNWAERFPSIKGIPRGYLVLSDPNQVLSKGLEDAPVQFHPCTVMEYTKGDIKLYDFVYATADTRVSNYRKSLETFFEEYKNKHGRNGSYLFSADVGNPIWEAEFTSPEALLRSEPGSKAHLKLLEERIRNQSFRERNIESILEMLTRNYDNESLGGRVTSAIGISRAQWYHAGSIADSASQLLQKCIELNKVEELLDSIARDYPELFI
jgi:hypothetical protein